MHQSPPPHPVLPLDDVVHQRVRLGILAVLHSGGEATFGYLKQHLELTDGNLNRHLDVLARAGLVEVTKDRAARRTLAAITERGWGAFESELAQLEALIANARRTNDDP